MDASSFLEPSVGGYLRYCLGFCLRYFLVLGGIYWILQVAYRQYWHRYRVQQPFPPAHDVVHEIRWSMVNMAATGLATMLLYHLVRTDRTGLYFDVAKHGWSYLVFSIVLTMVLYDAWGYWTHRLLHLPSWFRHVHEIHHRSLNPTVFAAFTRHPVEGLLEQVFFVSTVVFLPLHVGALAFIILFFFVNGLVAHCGYEFYPGGFTRQAFGQWINTSTHHNMHHRLPSGCNYSICFNWWDRLLGTNHASYHEGFDAVTVRRGPVRPWAASQSSQDDMLQRSPLS